MHIPTVPPLPLRSSIAVGRIGAIGRPASVLPAAPLPHRGGRRLSLVATVAARISALLRPLAARSVSG